MIIECEGCGKQYKIDPEKMKDEKAKFKCKSCSHLIVVTKTESAGQAMDSLDEELDSILSPSSTPEEAPASEAEDEDLEDKASDNVVAGGERKRKTKGMSLRTKMIFLFMIIPILIISGSSAIYLKQMKSLASLITDESMQIVKQLAEDTVLEISKGVASQCKIYLENHPELKKESFNNDFAFKMLAVQKIGMTGFTMLYEIPEEGGAWRSWAHVDPNIIGLDMSQLEDVLGTTFAGFWKIFTGVKDGVLSRGYHSWQDREGNLRERFMVCIPIEGTPYVIAAITYIDEFTRAIKLVETRAGKREKQASQMIAAMLLATLIIIGLVVIIYGYKLTASLRELTDVADRISIGDLDARIELKSKDEIGDLADAIHRMQDSIRLSIERLRRRRK
jgi:predicted Zn finger-like uncharacterized protein